MSEQDELRAWLRLARDEDIACVAETRRPPSDVAEGLSIEPSPSAMHDLVAALRAQPDLTLASGPLASARARFWDADPAVVVVEVAGVARARGAVASLGEGAWLLDARSEPAWLAIEDAEGTAIVRVDGVGVRWLRAKRGETELAAPSAADVAEEPVSVARWLGEETAQPWLIDEANRLASSFGTLSVAKAAGLVARVWSPPPGAARRDALARRLRGDDGPVARVQRWARSQPRSEWRAVEDAAVQEAAACSAALVTTCLRASIDRAQARTALAALVRRRDDLESVAFVLRAAGCAEVVGRSLAALDDAAASHLSALMWIGLDADERIMEVAWQEPSAWWGALGAARQ